MSAQEFNWSFETGGGVELGAEIPARMRESDGTVYYVNNANGSDSDDGLSEANAWASISKAFADAAPNAQVKVMNTGTPYDINSLGISRVLTDEDDLVTVEAYDPESRPVLLGNLDFSSAAYFRVRNIIFEGDVGQTGTRASNASHHIEWVGCTSRNGDAGTQGFQGRNTTHHLWWVNCDSFNNGGTTQDHGWYIAGGTDFYLLNCIAYGNAGYGYQIYSTSADLTRIYFYNCLGDDNFKTSGRSAFICQGDHVDGSANTPRDIHYYNCIGTNHVEGGTNWGWRLRHTRNQTQSTIDNWAGGYPKVTVENCLSYNNVDGDLQYSVDAGASQASTTTVSGFITGQDPLFTNQASRDYSLQAGSPCIGAGLADYTPPFDFTGATRTAADLGPYAA